MKNNQDKDKALTTRIVEALQKTGSADDVHADFISQHIRDVKDAKNLSISEYRLDGRDVLDALKEKSLCESMEQEVQSVYSSNIYYKITIEKLTVRFCMNLRQGEECHAAEFYYGQKYLFNAIFMTPEDVVDILLESASKNEKWEKHWRTLITKCRKTAALKQLSETAIDSYLKMQLKGKELEYYTIDRKESVEVYFRLPWGMKFMVSLPHTGFQQSLDEAIAKVEDLIAAMNAADEAGRHYKLTYNEDWQKSITL